MCIASRIYTYIAPVLLIFSGISCSRQATTTAGEGVDEVSPLLATLLADSATEQTSYDLPGATPPDGGCVRLRVHNVGGNYNKVFNDSNYRHLEYARAGGILPPAENLDIWHRAKGIIRVRSNKYVYIDTLKHSYAYLMPHAAELLDEIGQRFADSLAAHGGGAYRIKATSLLRTPLTVGKLRHVNRNATAESAHQYATTFDISYSKFICDDSTATHRTFDDLKDLLARIVYDLRAQGRCYVKHERRQACFHITAAPPSDNPTD